MQPDVFVKWLPQNSNYVVSDASSAQNRLDEIQHYSALLFTEFMNPYTAPYKFTSRKFFGWGSKF